MTSLASFQGETFGWLMCFSFCVCQVTVCLIFIAQRTLLIETMVAPISVLQWMFVLLWRLHIDGVVYYSAVHCQLRETNWVCASDLISFVFFVKWTEEITHKYICCICLSSLLGMVVTSQNLYIWFKAHYHLSKTFVLSWDYGLEIIDINHLAWRLHLSCTYGSNI